MVQKVLQLKCSCNSYPWGRTGRESLAATLCEKTPGTDFKLDEKSPYAEMWMGTYPELPSYVLETGEDLQDVIDKYPDELLGKTVARKFNHTKLPYLPKVLSIAKALPLQLHPNKDLASKLHQKNPDQFTDPNHKPEIALALGDFEAFCGFKPLKDIERTLQLPPLQAFLPQVKKAEFDDQTLKHVVKSMLEASDDVVRKTNDALMALPKEKFGEDSYIPEMIPRLAEQYDKADNGTLVALITMNYLQLKEGESIYIPADGIHAYLSGDIIECMARSNNVLNTGFCPRADRDSVEMFTSCLTFTPHDVKDCMLPSQSFGKSSNGKSKLYAPPLSEFSMYATTLAAGESDTINKIGGPSVMIVTEGEGTLKAEGKEHKLSAGYIFFVGQGVELEFSATKTLKAFTAFAE
ncbi:mannose-6-phosphate isomerase [Parastagonospora nodorum]|uniref:Mannose-6-phosphate isomerase n=2 Tax=Phaeosphaeria nodorum (strain SN15 / ATCC MYA-4574 / FGSC 10173) TaxID=321614 RepID=A0A7U2HXR2_PHANO|nr:mannose-6-phosphate isomerase [Parastagonospora nodorum]QRC94259.1 mannose-6-phosphate isomerase [Parastagonospora nodorum SN15]KAH3928330.1 mannose-6-phosphate isomerase [Parastagonospora nodorum]KAH3946017.1 mannose-6-phosphate isomerase [Parastagonospora nodorum]KAH3983665.1 mannose-6-phosphate isomerase [Parastagonospora nodorum]